MNKALGGVPNFEVNLDGIVIHTDTWDRRVCDTSLALEKCELGKGTVTNLESQLGKAW